MSFNFLHAGARVLVGSIALTAMFAFGIGIGFYFYPRVIHVEEAHDEDDPHAHDEAIAEEDDHEHEEHVALTKQAYENLQLEMGPYTRDNYRRSVLMPGQVVEIPGRSDLSISAPVSGVVEQVRVLPGQSLNGESELFLIRLTDESLIDAQSKLLDTLTRQEVVQQEIDRLIPIIESGAVSGTRKRDLEYELTELAAQKTTLIQELRGRGLPEPLVQQVLNERILASTLSVFPPGFVQSSGESERPTSGYSVEDLFVHPGKTIARGDALCSVAFHLDLYIEGIAFDTDLPALSKAAEMNWPIIAEMHHQHGDHLHSTAVGELELLRVDNHIDETTQSVKFYLELSNEVTRTRLDEGRTFEQWRYRPGQRIHLRLPTEVWEDQILLPSESVVVDGPNAFVFVDHHEFIHARGLEHDHEEHDEIFIELEPLPIQVLYRNDSTVVVADDGQLLAGDRIALNSAYKLYMTLQMQAGGGGHHHHHDH